jgi:hypothetical protein
MEYSDGFDDERAKVGLGFLACYTEMDLQATVKSDNNLTFIS